MITSRAWCVLDVSSGEQIAAENEKKPVKIASLVKLMTAGVVDEILTDRIISIHEQVKFDSEAARIWGSSAEIKAGEKLSIEDCLHGMLLPSGNDAAIAIAKHFVKSGYLDSRPNPSVEEKGAAYRRPFVSAMNKKAVELGLSQTRFSSVFTDSPDAEDATSTVLDVALLAKWILSSKIIAPICKKKDHVGVARTATEARHVSWKNTNKLISSGSGWCHGLKTGTSKNAGFCLALHVCTDRVDWILVLVGASSDADRYRDAQKILDLAKAKTSIPCFDAA